MDTLSETAEDELNAIIDAIENNTHEQHFQVRLPPIWHIQIQALCQLFYSVFLAQHRFLFVISNRLEKEMMQLSFARWKAGMPTAPGDIGIMGSWELLKWLDESQGALQRGLVVVFGLWKPHESYLRAMGRLQSRMHLSVQVLVKDDERGKGLTTISFIPDKPSTPFPYKKGTLTLDAVKGVIDKGQNVVVFGGSDVGTQCLQVSQKLGIQFIQLPGKEAGKAERLQNSDLSKTLIWGLPFFYACALPIPNVGLVVSVNFRTRYFCPTNGRFLYGEYIDDVEVQCHREFLNTPDGTMVTSYDARDVSKYPPGILSAMSFRLHEPEVLYAVHSRYPSTNGVPQLLTTAEDQQLFAETVRQLKVQGLVKGNTPDFEAAVDMEIIIMMQMALMPSLYPGMDARGYFWTSTCMIALAQRTNMPWIIRRIAVRAALVSACFPSLIKTNGTNEDLVALCKGPAAALAEYGWLWLTLGLWEAATRELLYLQPRETGEQKTICNGRLTVNMKKYTTMFEIIAKCESKLSDGHPELGLKEWFECTNQPLTGCQLLMISELLMWGGLFNSVFIPKNNPERPNPYSGRSLTTVEWDKDVTCGVDIHKSHDVLSPGDTMIWMGIAHDFGPGKEGNGSLATDSITLIPVELMLKVKQREKNTPFNRIILSTICDAGRQLQ